MTTSTPARSRSILRELTPYQTFRGIQAFRWSDLITITVGLLITAFLLGTAWNLAQWDGKPYYGEDTFPCVDGYIYEPNVISQACDPGAVSITVKYRSADHFSYTTYKNNFPGETE